jgi:hypothetical protein
MECVDAEVALMIGMVLMIFLVLDEDTMLYTSSSL